jgi:hypothetical protein
MQRTTALDVLTKAGVPDPESKIGSVRVRIAGLRGINTPNHKITFQDGVSEADILVGEDSYSYTVEHEAQPE